MAENQNDNSGKVPRLQKRLAAASANRRLRHIGNALNFIACLLMVAGATVGGLAGELLLIAAFAALSFGGVCITKGS